MAEGQGTAVDDAIARAEAAEAKLAKYAVVIDEGSTRNHEWPRMQLVLLVQPASRQRRTLPHHLLRGPGTTRQHRGGPRAGRGGVARRAGLLPQGERRTPGLSCETSEEDMKPECDVPGLIGEAADIRAQLDAVTRERDALDREAQNWADTASVHAASRDTAIARAEAAEAKLAKYAVVIDDPDVFRLRSNHDAAVARAEAAEKERDERRETVTRVVEMAKGYVDERDAAVARAEAAERALERWRHGVTIEGDFVCPDSLRAEAAEAQVDRLKGPLVEGKTWRVGRTLGRTLYKDGIVVGMVDTVALAEDIVEAMNGELAEQFAAVRAEERAAIAAWLREEQVMGGGVNYVDAIGAIEAGEHEEP